MRASNVAHNAVNPIHLTWAQPRESVPFPHSFVWVCNLTFCNHTPGRSHDLMLSLCSLFLLQCEHDSHYLVLSMTWSFPFVPFCTTGWTRDTISIDCKCWETNTSVATVIFARHEKPDVFPAVGMTASTKHTYRNSWRRPFRPIRFKTWSVLAGNNLPIKHIKIGNSLPAQPPL